MKKIIFPFLFLNILNANEFTHTLSNQGFTGVVNTPNAQVINQGDFVSHFDNQFTNSLRGYDYDKKYTYLENYIFGVGMFKNFEIQGRLSEAPHYHRDLSANVKFKFPYTHKYLPNIAFGIQDLGGAANFYDNKYVVLDKEFFDIARISVGYGKVDDSLPTNRKRMDGLFNAVEVKTFDWLYLVAEDDTKEKFVGVRLELPKSFKLPFKFNSLITSNLTDNNQLSMAFNLTFPLYETKEYYDRKTTIEYQQDFSQKESTLEKKQILKKSNIPSDIDNDFDLDKLVSILSKIGLENLTIAIHGSTIYISYENNVFVNNDIDAMGVTIGLLSKTKYSRFILEQTKSKLPVLTISGDLEKAKEFYKDPNITTKYLFANSIQKIENIELENYKIIFKNNSTFNPRLELSPRVITFVGNEFGVFNYKLWLRGKFLINLFSGVNLSAIYNLHLYDSEPENHIYDGFLRLFEDGSYMDSVMLHLSTKILNGINTLSIGTYNQNYKGISNQYINNIGNHTIELKAGYFKQFKDGDFIREYWLGKFEKRDFYLAKYSYLLDEYDFLTEINFGKYWNQDKGFDVKFKRYFGDTAIYLSYSQSKANTIFSEQVDKYAGIGVEIPLSFRYTKSRIRGINNFNYHLKTTVGRADGTNSLVPGGNVSPYMGISQKTYFYNKNRLQLSYIKNHLFRFHESYVKYVLDFL